MSGQRQKNQREQLTLAFVTDGEGEAPTAAMQGSEPLVAKRELERPAANVSLMEEVCQREYFDSLGLPRLATRGTV